MHVYPPPLRRLAYPLASLAGFVDAYAFAMLGGFFTSFMSGNTTRAGVALLNGGRGEALVAGGILAAFVTGVILATLLARSVRATGSGQTHKGAVMLLVAALLALGAASLNAGRAPGATLVLLAAAMGAENGVYARDGEVAIGVTYFTGALVKLGQRLAHALLGDAGAQARWQGLAAMWLAFAAGGVAGAAGAARLGAVGLYLAAGAAVLLASALEFASRADGAGRDDAGRDNLPA